MYQSINSNMTVYIIYRKAMVFKITAEYGP